MLEFVPVMDWTRIVFHGMEWLWLLLGAACLIGAALLVLQKLSVSGIEDRLRSLETTSPRSRLPVLFWGLCVPFLLTLFKLAQYHSFHLMSDSAVMGNVVWNVAHGYGLTSSIYGGKSYLAIHFAFTYALLAPIVLLWNSMAALVLAHGLAVGSAALASFLLVSRLGGGPLLSWLTALMLLSNPLYHGATISFIDNVNFAPAIFLWGAYCWETGRRKSALMLALLLLTTREQIPFLLFGLGLYMLLRAKEGKPRMAAMGVMGASILLWLGEMAVIRRAKEELPRYFDFWHLYGPLGGSPGALLHNAMRRPWLFLLTLVYPPVKLWTIAKTLLPVGLLPLASGWAMIPALTTWAPQQLAIPNSFYHRLHEHYASCILGPLFWSAAHGLVRLYQGMDRAQRRLIVAWVLGVSGSCFLLTGDFIPPERSLPDAWRTAAPHAMAQIPPDAKLWCDPFLSPHLSLRRHIKCLPQQPDVSFGSALFAPDRVLLSAHWIRRSDPKVLDAMFAFFRSRGYVRIFEEADLAVLAAPWAIGGPMGPVEWIKL